jgi:hypothetical protein
MQGRCLCGAVTIDAPANLDLNACHCGMCRRWGSGPFFSFHGGSDLRISGAEHITAYRSSEWAERAFCRNCGTHLFYRLLPANDHELAAGLFQDGAAFRFREEIFIDSKPAYYEFANATTRLTEAEVFAKYAPPG